MQSLNLPDLLPAGRLPSTKPAAVENDGALATLARKARSGLQRDGYYLVRGSGCWWESCLGRWAHFGRHWNDLRGDASWPGADQAVRRRSSLWWRRDAGANAVRLESFAPDACDELPEQGCADRLAIIVGEPVADPCFLRLMEFCATVLRHEPSAHALAIETAMVRLRENRAGLVSCNLTRLIGVGAAHVAIALIAKRNLVLGSITIRLSRPGCVGEALLLHPQDVLLLDLNRIAVGPLSWMCIDCPHPGIVDFLMVQPSDLKIAGSPDGPVWLS
jgi:hypothetical protein